LEPVAQPLDRSTGGENRGLEGPARLLTGEARGGGPEHAVRRGLLCLDEDERACAVRRLRAARREQRRPLVARDALDRQGQAEQLSLAEVRARRPDLRQEFARDAEQVEELVVPVERVERAEQRARRVRLVGEVVAALGQLPHEPRVDGAEREAAWT